MRLLLILLLLLAVPVWGGEPVRIGVLATRPKPMVMAQWQPLAVKLKQKIPARDFVIEAMTFAELETAVSSRNLEFVLTNPGDYVMLAQHYGLSSPLATLISLADGQPQHAFGGVIITRSDRDDIKRLEDVRGKRVAMTGFESMGAYQMQAYELALKGVRLPQDAQLTATEMPHDKVVEAVLGRQADVGFVRTGILEEMSREGRLDMSSLKILNQQNLPGLPWAASTRLYPEWPFAAMPQVDKSLASDVTSVLFQLHDDPALTRHIGIFGFTIPSDYRVVENLLRKLRLPPFDVEPEFTWQDVWNRYRLWMVALGLSGVAILALLLLVWHSRRRLLIEREQVLYESKRYQAMLHTAGDGIHVLDLDGNLLEANDAFCRMLGRTREEIRGMNVTQWDMQIPTEELKKQMRELGERSITIETRHRRQDGSVIDVEVNVAGVEIGGRHVLFCAARDITRRKQSENELAEKEYRHRLLIENSPFCIHEIGLDGRLQSMNKAGLDMLGLDDEKSVIGLPYMGAVGEQDYALVAALLEDAIKGTASHFQFVSSGENPRHFKSCFIPIKGAEGRVIKLMGITEDITDRKAAEEALLRSNADLERFAYSVSHDMRAPLRTVSGHLQLLQRSLKDKLEEDDRENLAFALDGAKRMDAMIVSLLEYSRVGRLTEQKGGMQARESLDEALGFLAASIKDKQAEISVAGEWPEVYASRDELTRLFQNLIGNALHYHEPGMPPVIEINSSVGAETWRVSVHDHGIGIDPKQIERLFQFFSRLHARSRFEGTGMGLALCRRIVEHHNGRIWAESEGEGKGSTFIFEMPLKVRDLTSEPGNA